jgi:diguanylate cyclase (GGDEF)-like protein
MPNRKTAVPGFHTPDDTKIRLKDAIYADFSTLVIGAAMTTIIATFFWLLTGQATPLVVALATPVLTAFRYLLVGHGIAELTRWREIGFGVCTFTYLLAIGGLTIWGLFETDSLVITWLAVTLHIVNVMSIALRFFAVRHVVLTHLTAMFAPVLVAFCWRGGPFYVAAFIAVVVAYFVYTSAERLRAILRSEIIYRRRSETVATQFRFAIDNMSHGMCMIDSNMRIAVSNAQLAECFGLAKGRSLQGVRFCALVRLARRYKALDAAEVASVTANFAATRANDGLAQRELIGADGRVRDVTIKRNDEGGWVLVAQDVTEQRRAREALDVAARVDAMTGLPNRNTFETRLAETLRGVRGLSVRTEVMFLDLDRFKQVNDTMGHKVGDRVLVESANRLRHAAGDEGFAARWGGDEFVILRQGRDEGSMVGFAERLIAEMSRPMWIEGAEIVVGASVGVAVCGDGLTSMETLLQHADMALYTAKRERRGACRIYETAMNDRLRERRLLELDLQSALAARTFDLRYQPIVDLETGDLISFEALAQWRHPVRGVVSPALFVPVLEELNLMHSFGAWTLMRACEDAMRWPQPVRVGVNVSARQFDTLLEAVRRALATSGLPASRLELEITETAALEGGDECRRILEEVRAMGVRIALDDFGTGYSSLSHLMSLPLDKVKIDKSFTQQLGLSRKADVLVSNIARLSSQLGMRVTFEGVETEEQLERARAVGVPAEGQGWLFGRATPMDEIGRFFPAQGNEQAVA